MPEEFASPEEKLLRLIRGERKPKDKALSPAEKENVLPREGDSKAVAVARGRKITPPQAQFEGGGNYVKFINITLVAILVVIVVVLLADVINFNRKRPVYLAGVTREAPEYPEPKTQPPVPPQPKTSSPVPANLYDSELLTSKNLFKASPVAAAPPARIPQASYDKLKDLTLKGIIAGDKPQAIIEDEKSNKSYFLYKGESINDIKVEDIQSDRVKLNINGEVLELTL